jgi:type II secretory pathway component GspD/PulD (secretin)
MSTRPRVTRIWEDTRLRSVHAPMRPIHLVLAALLAACSTPTRDAPEVRSAAAAGAVLEVVPVQHANASELADVIRRALAAKQQAVVADVRTNSLILNGTAEEVTTMKGLISKLDVPAGH